MTTMLARRLVLAALVAIATGFTVIVAAQPSPPPDARLAVTIPVAPQVVPMDRRAWLVFELHIANPSPTPITLRDVTITDADRNAIARINGDAVVRQLDASTAPASGRADVAPGTTRVIYVDAPLPEALATVPDIRYEVLGTTSQGGHIGVRSGLVAVDRRAPSVLGPPLAGGPWVAIHHPDWERGHRRVFYTVSGVARLPGRFTIDFVKVDRDGRTARGDADVIVNSLGYGAEVLAVADATVAATRDDMTEAPRVSERRKHSPDDAAGNYVSLDLGRGRFAVYEHLKPGSIRVRPGQVVARGEVVAQVGFTGDSTGPHLHLHVGDSAVPLAAEGRPFIFDRVEVLGRYPDIAAMGKARWRAEGAGLRANERAGPNTVIDFGIANPPRER